MLDSKATLTLALTTETFKKCIQRLNHGGSRHGFVSWCILKSRDFMIPQFKKSRKFSICLKLNFALQFEYKRSKNAKLQD